MSRSFYPFVEQSEGGTGVTPASEASVAGTSATMASSCGQAGQGEPLEVRYPARVAVYDDPSAAPRVIVIEPKDIRDYLEEITATVSRLSKEQGGTLPFMVIREVVENFIHSYFRQPTISILDGGDTIRFSDQGPGIEEKERALEYGTTSATEEMRRYIRGVGSGLPYVQQYMQDKGGSLTIDDNMAGGTIVTISAVTGGDGRDPAPGAPLASPQNLAQVDAFGRQIQPPPPVLPQQLGYPIYQAYPVLTQALAPQAYQQRPHQAQHWQQDGHAYPQGEPASPQPTAGVTYPQPTVPTAPQIAISLSERGRAILSYLTEHASVGPTELTRRFGHSQPTWTRELQALEEMGLVAKRKGEQKRSLTVSGQAIVARMGQ